MINRIERKFQELKQKKEKALIFFLTVGYPDVPTFKKLVITLAESGVDLIELGIPFSDPVADGLTIQKSSQEALKKKINLKKSFLLAKELSRNVAAPFVFMGYYNPIYRYGLENFSRSCKKNHIDGVIIPDLPPEEAAPLDKVLKKYGIDLIFLIAPTSSEKRIEMISKQSRGFIYYVSLTGVTGARQKLPGTIKLSLSKIRRFTEKPICVGFGISRPSQAKEIVKYSDGIIIGSALLKIVEKYKDNEKILLREVKKFVSGMKAALKLKGGK